MDLKKQAANHAMDWIKSGMRLGLGAGSSVAHVVDGLPVLLAKGYQIECYTASASTAILLRQRGISPGMLQEIDRIDLYMDGCDQVDTRLNALKSLGGIHTHEKLLASMAASFILLGDDQKYRPNLDTTCPLAIEVIPEAAGYVVAAARKLFAEIVRTDWKQHPAGGAFITPNSNYIYNLWFRSWPELSEINPMIKSIPGVLETSLFYQMASQAIMAGPAGVRVLDAGR